MQLNKLANYAVIFIASVLLAIVLKTFGQVLRPLAIATLLLFLFTPLARLSRRKKIPPWITFTGIIIVIVLLLALGSSFIKTDNLDLEKAIPEFQERVIQESGSLLEALSGLGFNLGDWTPEKIGQYILKTGMNLLGTARAIFSETLLALILLMFLIQSRPIFFRVVEQRFGKEKFSELEDTYHKISRDIGAYFGTKTAMSLGTALLSGAVLWMFQAKFIAISMFIIFMLNFIPIIGSLIAVVIVLLLFALTFGLSGTLVWLALALIAIQVLFGSILEPKIAGKRLNISPILIIISLYVWGWIWGILGMLLSVPLTILILIALKHIGPEKPAESS